jgi:ABC-type dipeptide/oligopeptide/nickel transport system permease subunit
VEPAEPTPQVAGARAVDAVGGAAGVDDPEAHQGASPDAPAAPGRRSLGLWADTWRRLKRNKLAVVGMCIIVIFLVVGVSVEVAYLFGHSLTPYDPNGVNYKLSPKGIGAPPSWAHPFGTDYIGRDILSRTIIATRVSLIVGVIAVAIALAIGLVAGPVSGYYGGAVDSLLTVLGPGFVNVFIAIGLLSWASYARLNRGSVLSVKAMEFIEAARAQGASDLRIIFRHVLPNTMAPVYVAIAMGVGGAIVTEAGLSFLGIGIQAPDASWGKMIADYQGYLPAGSWWMLFFPCLALVITVFGFISFGNGLRDATDPKLKE